MTEETQSRRLNRGSGGKGDAAVCAREITVTQQYGATHGPTSAYRIVYTYPVSGTYLTSNRGYSITLLFNGAWVRRRTDGAADVRIHTVEIIRVKYASSSSSLCIIIVRRTKILHACVRVHVCDSENNIEKKNTYYNSEGMTKVRGIPRGWRLVRLFFFPVFRYRIFFFDKLYFVYKIRVF